MSLRKSISKVVVLLNDNSESEDSDSSAETRPLQLVNDGPLSVTIFHCSPCVVNTDLSFSMVLADEMDCMMWASNHFEWASTRTRNMWPRNGPAKIR